MSTNDRRPCTVSWPQLLTLCRGVCFVRLRFYRIMEEEINVVRPELVKRKLKLQTNEKRKIKQRDLYSAKTLPEKPKCDHNKKSVYKCATLTSNDVFYFHKKFYRNPEKISQDNYILQNMLLYPVRRKRPRNNIRNGRTFSKQYFVTRHSSKEKLLSASLRFVAF